MNRSLVVATVLACLVVPSGVSALRAQEEKRPEQLDGHRTAVLTLAYSPDGKTLASGAAGRDTVVKLWDVATGKERLAIAAHKQHVHTVAFSPDGKTLATGSADRTARLWDPESGKEKAVIRGFDREVHAVAFSPDGKTLAAGTDTGVKLFDAETGKEKAALKAPYGRTVVFHPRDNNLLLVVAHAGPPLLWDVAADKALITFKGHTRAVSHIAVSPDGKTLASVSTDHTLRLWDAATGKELAVITTQVEAYLQCVAFSPDGKTVAGGGFRRTVWRWDVATQKELPARTEKDGSSFFAIAFSPDGKTIAAAGVEKIRLWDVAGEK